MESLFYPPQCDCESLFRLPPSVNWANGKKDPRDWAIPENLLPWLPEFLEPILELVQVCTKLPLPTCHWTDSLPVCHLLGYQPPLFPASGEPSDVPAIDHHHLQSAVSGYKLTQGGPILQSFSLIKTLCTRDIKLHLPCRKLSPRYIDSFAIIR